MTYVPLGPRRTDAILDQTGNNTGNWTNAFTSDVIDQRIPYFECQHIVITNVPAGASATVFIGAMEFSYVEPLNGSEWDPSQPMLLRDSQDVYFYWNVPATGTPPRVVMWFRYDPALVPGGKV